MGIEFEKFMNFYPKDFSERSNMTKHILKEYVELLSLSFISSSQYVSKLSFIGGTNLRLVKRIDRFSEDLDFDCKNMSHDEFIDMTDKLMKYLEKYGFSVEAKEKESDKLTAYRRSIKFPELLYNMGITGHKEERFMLKIEAQDQGLDYKRVIKPINMNGFNINIPVPPDNILCAMKLSAMITRQKGRDFYDSMFLLQQTKPDFNFLKVKCGIDSFNALEKRLNEVLEKVDLNVKEKDFEHLLFFPNGASSIHGIKEFIHALNKRKPLDFSEEENQNIVGEEMVKYQKHNL